MMDWGGGLIWATVPAGTDVRAALGPLKGHATLMSASGETLAQLGRFQPESPGVRALSDKLRQQFDPKGLFQMQIEEPAL